MKSSKVCLTLFIIGSILSSLSIASSTPVCNVYFDSSKNNPYDVKKLDLILVYRDKTDSTLKTHSTTSKNLEIALKQKCPELGKANLDSTGEDLKHFQNNSFIKKGLKIRPLGHAEQKALLFSKEGDKSHLLIGQLESLYNDETPYAFAQAIVEAEPYAHATPVSTQASAPVVETVSREDGRKRIRIPVRRLFKTYQK